MLRVLRDVLLQTQVGQCGNLLGWHAGGAAMIKSAVISKCGLYRMSLVRKWDETLPQVLFIGVNPSTADAEHDDHTIRKLIGFTRRWDYGGFEIVNLFAYRATDVKQLRNHYNRDTSMNVINNERLAIADALRRSALVVPCWGGKQKLPKDLHHRMYWVREMLARPLAGQWVGCFGKTSCGEPRHPLMLSYDTKLERFG